MDYITLLCKIKSLRSIIECINEENCYDEVIKFFKLTSELQDCSEGFIGLLPSVEGSETNRAKKVGLEQFLEAINRAGRNGHGSRVYNRTNPGELITKNNIYFGNFTDDVCSFMGCLTISQLETEPDLETQECVRKHITAFVKSFSFNTDWLK